MSILTISLLGTPIIQLDQQPVTFESRKAIALLAFLAIEGEPRLRSELATMLWPESDTKRARGALRYTLSVIQNKLGKTWLHSNREVIGLIPHEHCVVDTNQFQQLLAVGRDHTHTPDTACLDCISEINAAVTLYRDDFLTGFGLRDSVNFDEWQFFQVEGFRHQLANALRILIRYHIQQADYHQALTSVRRLLQLDPLQESIHRKAMQLYAQTHQWEFALQQYKACAQLLDAELGIEPSPATLQLYEQIRAQRVDTSYLDDGLPSSDPKPARNDKAVTELLRPHNLPVAPAPILGRTTEINEICQLLADPYCRMVTILGPGGIGKTRLAHQIAIELCNASETHFADEIYFISLVAVETNELLVTEIASALNFPFSGSMAPKEQLFQYLHERRMLLVLDNFEQLVASAPLLVELLNAAHGIKLLVTSRERLNLHEEWLTEIQGLPLPPAKIPWGDEAVVDLVAEAEQNGAVQLFYHRARQLEPRFNLAEALPVIVEICHLLQGMPLGIELAAGWVRTFSTSEIARQIQRDLDFLATPYQNVPERHRSLRAAFTHSWRGLNEREQAIFARAAIFRNGFSLEAATEVIGANPVVLGALVDKSLLRHIQRQAEQPDRYSIHELLRQYAEEKIEPEQRNVVYQDYCNYFARFVEKRLPHCGSGREDMALREIGSELDNIRAAWAWMVEQIQTTTDESTMTRWASTVGKFVPMLAHYYQRYSRYEEGQQLFLTMYNAMRRAGWQSRHANDEGPSCSFRLAQVEARLAEFAFNLSLFHEVSETYSRLLPYFRQVGEPFEIGTALAGLGKTWTRMGRYAEAEPVLLESLEIFRSIDEAYTDHTLSNYVVGITTALNSLGILYSNQGQFEQARPYYEEFLAISRAKNYLRGTANALNNLGSNYARAGEHEKALPFYQDSYRLALKSSERLMIAVALSNLGSVSRALHKFDDSRRYYTQSLSICREIGERRWTAAGLNGLGMSLIDDHALEEAIPHLKEALLIAQEIESLPDMLDALSALGAIFVKQDNLSLGVKILRFVLSHPVTQTLSRVRSQELIDQIDPKLVATDEPNFNEKQIDQIVLLATELTSRNPQS